MHCQCGRVGIRTTQNNMSFHYMSTYPESSACLCSSRPRDELDTAWEGDPVIRNPPLRLPSFQLMSRNMMMRDTGCWMLWATADWLTILEGSHRGRRVQCSSGGAFCTANCRPTITRSHTTNGTRPTVCWTTGPLQDLARQNRRKWEVRQEREWDTESKCNQKKECLNIRCCRLICTKSLTYFQHFLISCPLLPWKPHAAWVLRPCQFWSTFSSCLSNLNSFPL